MLLRRADTLTVGTTVIMPDDNVAARVRAIYAFGATYSVTVEVEQPDLPDVSNEAVLELLAWDYIEVRIVRRRLV